MKSASMIAMSLALLPAAAFAQQSPVPATQSPDAGKGTDIVVTANREKSLASKTPIALTAISGKDLVKSGITSAAELGEQVAGVSLDRSGTTSGLQITIRGVTSSDLSEKGDPSAAFLLDGVYIARPQAQEVAFFDIARVEVLRGPQGTLYGRNTTAGVINVISNQPRHTFEASLDASAGNFGARQVTGMINLPVTPVFALRAAINYDRRDSYLIPGPQMTSKIDPFVDNLSGRLSALADWNSGTLVLHGDYSHMGGYDANTVPMSNLYAGGNVVGVDPTYLGVRSSTDVRTIRAPLTGDLWRRSSTWGIGADLNQTLGPVALAYVGSYRRFDRNEQLPLYNEDASQTYGFHFQGRYSQVSQELRFATHDSGPLKAQAGGYYFRETASLNQDIFGYISPVPDTTGYDYRFQRDPNTSTSLGAFAQATYSFLPWARLTAGIRYSHDRKTRVGFTGVCATTGCNLATDSVVQEPVTVSFSKVTWRAGIDADLNARTLAYATISSGYKAGGYNDGCLASQPGCTTPMAPAALFYKPETLVSYEVGIKTRTADNTLRFNLSAFHYDYSNLQLSQASTICGAACILTTNAARAKINGVEIETVLQPSPRNRFTMSASWLDAHYSEFMPLPTISFAGRELDRSPRWSIMSSYAYTLPLAEGSSLVAGVHNRMSDTYNLSSTTTGTMFRQPSYTKTDVDLTYNAPDGRWYVQGFAKNLENTIVVSSVLNGVLPSIQLGDPRTYGVRAGMKF